MMISIRQSNEFNTEEAIMIDDCMVFNAVFNFFIFHRGDQCTYSCFPGILFTNSFYIFFRSHWLLFHITIVETMDSGERGMTMINPRKEYWPSPGIEPTNSLLSSPVSYRLRYEVRQHWLLTL